jgi:hypothetical protein
LMFLLAVHLKVVHEFQEPTLTGSSATSGHVRGAFFIAHTAAS